jgi:hypothetical protein
MGMFDTIYCRRPLPDGTATHEDFQSKSLHNTLSAYEIGTDGRLRELEIDDRGQAILEKSKDTGFHGVMRFYTYVGKELKEYEAKFTDGLLVDLRSATGARYDERGMLLAEDMSP